MKNSITSCEEISWLGNWFIPLEDICKCTLDEPVNTAISYIIDKRHSHIPVLDSNQIVVGVFSVSTLMEIVGRQDPNRNGSPLASIKADLIPSNHKTEMFKFVSITNTIAEIRKMYEEAQNDGKHIGLFLVTDDGLGDEPLRGIFTKWDFAKVSARLLSSHENQGVKS